MCFLKKMLKKTIKRILKVTVYKVLWIILCLFILIIIVKYDFKPFCETENNSFQHPVILWWTKGFPGTSDIRQCDDIKCSVISNKNVRPSDVNAYLFYGSNIDFDDLPLPRRPDKVIWGLYHEESPRNVAELSHEHVLNLFNFSSTLSRYSDVPFPLQYLDSLQDIIDTKHFVKTREKNALLKDLSPIMYLQTDCETATERDNYVEELMKFIHVDSYGACLRNKEMPAKFKTDYLNNMNEDDFLNFIARYKFVIAIENGVCDDYVTEKFWRAIKVGSVPIYFGSPSIRDWFPNNKSAILLEEFPTPQLMADHLKELMANDDLYEEYLEHKTRKIILNKRLINELTDHSYQTDALETVAKFECLICKEIHNAMIGLSKINVVNKRHYDCPKPISALSLQVNPSNSWVYTWETSRRKAESIYITVLSRN